MNRVNFGVKPWIVPMPVLIIGTYDENGVPNAMNAAWGMVSDFNEVSISLSKHKTTANFLKTGAFTVSFATEDYVKECDYVGIESGLNNPDKFKQAGFHDLKSEFVNAPLIKELPLALECKVKSFNDGILVGEIVNVSADESIVEDGEIVSEKLRPIIFNTLNGTYNSLGNVVGYAFKDGLKIK